MRLTKQERETVIDFNEAEGVAHIHTMSAPVWRGLERKGFRAISEQKNGQVYGKEFEIPKNLVSIRRARTKRPMSARQRKVLSERLAAARARKPKTRQISLI